MLQHIRSYMRLDIDRRGVTSLEYGLLAGVLVATILIGFSVLMNDLQNKFVDIAARVQSAP